MKSIKAALPQLKRKIPLKIRLFVRAVPAFPRQLKNRVPTRGQAVEYLYRKLLRRPMVFRDFQGVLFEFSPAESYSTYLDCGTVQDDPAMVRHIGRTVQPGDIVIDVGAHIGSVCLLMGKLVGPEGRVFAFEAESFNYQRLLKNIGLNNLSSRVTSVNQAVYSSEGEIKLHVFDREASGWNTMGWYELSGWAPKETKSVASVTLDKFCNDNRIERVDLLKIDVEGAEPDVLIGAEKMLHRGSIRRIIFEVSRVPLHAMGYQANDIITPLIAEGYTLWKILEGGDLGPASEEEIADTGFANFVALCPEYDSRVVG